MLFGSLLWCIWCRRNDGIYGTTAPHSDTVLQRGLRMQQEVVTALVRSADGVGRVVAEAAVEKILRVVSDALPDNVIVEDIREMLSHDWIVVIRTIPHESNKMTNALAGSVCDDSVGVWLFDSPPMVVSHLVHKDLCDDIVVD
ncbi:hypothetical protein V6N11_030318 [Hibiscus sabdariffa]|uniref:RNase H type-1 domain-containing protein n=1 Tax=Hibiscus sabdariffa TaxID=183260 RepID=A0ABR2PKL6_9ROSI